MSRNLPTLSRTWTITPNNRISYVSLNDMIAHYLYGVKQFLVAHGYTVVGSSDGVSAGMDGVDRWVTFSNAATRGVNANAAQSWMCLRDGSGVYMLLCYQGGTDDLIAFLFSPGAGFTLAGTATFQPVASDQVNFSSGAAQSILLATTSGDRVWNGWVDSSRRLCRFCAFRQGLIITASQWGLEIIRSTTRSPAVFSPPVWGFTLSTNPLPNSSIIGAARPTLGSVEPALTWSASFGTEYFFNTYNTLLNTQTELTGALAIGWAVLPLSVYVSSTVHGKLGNLIDWWVTRQLADTDYMGDNEFILIQGVGTAGTTLWPWDGVSSALTV